MSTCSDPDRPDTDDETSQRSYSNASSPSASLQPTPNYVSLRYFSVLSLSVTDQLPSPPGLIRQWRSDHCRAESRPLTLRSFPGPGEPALLQPPPPAYQHDGDITLSLQKLVSLLLLTSQNVTKPQTRTEFTSSKSSSREGINQTMKREETEGHTNI